ncbi:DUF7261 family protein [Halobacterium zhouii]|uniref:DUF7261 family protein n=1 Tax=Halobacterium zhouii TaxID=2902624 RepID=UPI001E42C4C6|nr:hypothetical protein [Halobacterium zhouii]
MDSRDGRGQLILVAGFGLAVAFVALALVLNTVVFTENLATRNHDRTDEALAFEGAVEQGVGGIVSEVNDNESATYVSLQAELNASIPQWSDNATLLSAARGSLRNGSLAGVENGTRLARPSTGKLATGDLAVDVSETRRFQLFVTPESATGVTVEVAGDDDLWSVTVSNSTENPSWTDVVVSQNGDVVAQNTTKSNTVEVDLTEGLVNGTRVANWTFAGGVDAPYTISVTGDGETTGKYVLFVDEQVSDLTTDAPTATPAIYRAYVDISVRTDALTYESNVSVAPSDPPGNETYALDG